jgi:hypothetical protein
MLAVGNCDESCVKYLDERGLLRRRLGDLEKEEAFGEQMGMKKKKDDHDKTRSMPRPSAARATAVAVGAVQSGNGTLIINTQSLSEKVSPLTIYAKNFQKWLKEAPFQEIVAALAIAVGSLCLWDGPALWHFLFTGAIALVGAFVAYEEGKTLGLATTFPAEVFLAVEVGSVVGYATHCGFEGTQVMLGAFLGCLGAYGISAGPRSLDMHFPGVLLAWYSAGAMLGLLVYTTWRQSVLATFAPLLGGVLVSSGCGVLLGRFYLLLTNTDPSSTDGIVWFPSHDASWIEVFRSLIDNGGGGITLAALCGCALLGAVAQAMSGNRTIAIFLILGGIAFSTLAASGCQFIESYSDMRCPAWLRTEAAWQWLVLGSLLWACSTGISVYCQLGKHDPRSYEPFYGSHHGSRSTYFQVEDGLSASGRRHGKDAAYYVEAAGPPAMGSGKNFVTILPQDGFA